MHRVDQSRRRGAVLSLDRGWIAAHIPHAGGMCLLAEVAQWDADAIVCRADSHRAPDHPLRDA
ncbi:MAG TPA: hypothetical protein VF229_04890, partial [Burkholderiaceae bacterium]